MRRDVAGNPLSAAWRNMHQAEGVVRAALSSYLAGSPGCTVNEYELMSWLAVDTSRPLRMCDLAELAGLTRPGVTRAVERLVTRGWVERRPSPDDRREMSARLTETGRSALDDAEAAVGSGLTASLGAGLDDAELDRLRHLTGRILENAGARTKRRFTPSVLMAQRPLPENVHPDMVPLAEPS